MTEKKKFDLDDDATMMFAFRFIASIAVVVALSLTAAVVVGVVALVRWVF